MKSVCIVLHNHYDNDIRVRRKAEALISAGYSVDVLALREPNGPAKYTLGGAQVRAISLGKKRGSLARYAFEYVAFFLWAFFRVTVQMVRRHYVLIDVNNLPDFLVFSGVFAKWMGAKIVLDMHEITPEFYMSKYRMAENSSWVRVLRFLEKISLEFADKVININEPIEDLLVGRGLPREKSTIIMNSADESRFAAPISASGTDLGVAEEAFVFMYHGTLTPLYGLDIAVRAFAIAHQEMPGAEFWILGSGPDKPLLHELAKESGIASKVHLVGQVPSTQIPAWLRRCNVGVLPFRTDVFLQFASPNKLPEFIVSGTPVIVSRLGAIRHYFSESALAFCEPTDAADLAQQMVRVFQNSELRVRLVTQARKEYAPIRWEVMRDRYLRMIEATVGPADWSAESGVRGRSRGRAAVTQQQIRNA